VSVKQMKFYITLYSPAIGTSKYCMLICHLCLPWVICWNTL